MNDLVWLPLREPRVTFDVGLGKHIPQGMVLDFDQAEYRRFAQAEGQNVYADYAKIHVYGSTTVKNLVLGRAGQYDPGDRTIEVAFAGNPSTTNHRLRHESKHFFDDFEHKLTDHNAVAANLGAHALKLGGAATWLDVLALTLSQNETVRDVAAHAFPYLAGMSILGAALYYLQPQEIRARVASIKHRGIKPLKLVPAGDVAAT